MFGRSVFPPQEKVVFVIYKDTVQQLLSPRGVILLLSKCFTHSTPVIKQPLSRQLKWKDTWDTALLARCLLSIREVNRPILLEDSMFFVMSWAEAAVTWRWGLKEQWRCQKDHKGTGSTDLKVVWGTGRRETEQELQGCGMQGAHVMSTQGWAWIFYGVC